MTEQYTAPEGATHQNIGMPDLFYKAGSDGKVLYRRAANLSPDDIWEPSGYEENDALANTTVFRPLTPTWRDGAPPQVGWWHARLMHTLAEGAGFWNGRYWTRWGIVGKYASSETATTLCVAIAGWRGPRLTGPDWPEPAESKPKVYAPGVWHEWAGGECPIPPDQRFCYVRRDEPGKPCRAASGSDCYEWRHHGRWNEIIKFWLGSCLDEARAALESKPAEVDKAVDKDPRCRTPKDIEGEPAVLERIASRGQAADPDTPAELERWTRMYRMRVASRSFLTIATPDHRLGYWGAQGDE